MALLRRSAHGQITSEWARTPKGGWKKHGNGFTLKTKTSGGEALRAHIHAMRKKSPITGYRIGYPNAEYENGIQVAEVAKINEFGSPNRGSFGRGSEDNPKIRKANNTGIPPRPFFRRGNNKAKPIVRAILVEAWRRNLSKRANRADLEKAAKAHVEAIRNEIVNGRFKRNSPKTRKGQWSNPLLGVNEALHDYLGYEMETKKKGGEGIIHDF